MLATVVKSDTVLVDFSMTALDYLKSKERNIDIGVRTLHVPGSRTLRLLWRIIPSILIRLCGFCRTSGGPSDRNILRACRNAEPNKVLLPGQFTKVKLLLDVREGAVAVPQKAVTIEKGGAYIL